MVPKFVTEIVARMARDCGTCPSALDCSTIHALGSLATAVEAGDRLGALIWGAKLHDAIVAHEAPCWLVEADQDLLAALRAMISQALANPELAPGLDVPAMVPRPARENAA